MAVVVAMLPMKSSMDAMGDIMEDITYLHPLSITEMVLCDIPLHKATSRSTMADAGVQVLMEFPQTIIVVIKEMVEHIMAMVVKVIVITTQFLKTDKANE